MWMVIAIPDIIARAGDQRGIRVIRNLGSVIREEVFLVDPSEGGGDPGPRFVVADFDRDEQQEISRWRWRWRSLDVRISCGKIRADMVFAGRWGCALDWWGYGFGRRWID